MAEFFDLPKEEVFKFYETEILPQFQFVKEVGQWLDLNVKLELPDAQFDFFSSCDGAIYGLWSEDVFGDFEEIDSVITSAGFQAINYLPIRKVSKLVPTASPKNASYEENCALFVYSRRNEKLSAKDPIWGRDYILIYVKGNG